MSRVSAHGTAIKIGDGATPTENFTQIAQAHDITGPNLDMNVIDATDHDSGGVKSKVPGVSDPGQITFDVGWDPSDATHAALKTDHDAKTLRNFQEVLTDAAGTTVTFSAYVKTLQPHEPVDGQLTMSVTLELSGAVTW